MWETKEELKTLKRRNKMACRICGSEENVRYVFEAKQFLCKSCAADTPKKISRSEFDNVYWNGDKTVPEAIRREFYSDYLSSSNTLEEYIRTTSSSF